MGYLRNALLSAAVLALCLTGSSALERREFTAPIDKDGVQRVEIRGGSYYFTPDYISVKVNLPVEITLRKEGIFPHNFIIKAPEAGMDINVDLASEPRVVTFTPTKVGSYPLYCDKKFLFMESHREKGMEGTLEVRP